MAVILLGTCLFLIMRSATKYFEQAFPKYDELNASVQENVSAIRVVKAYVREDYETGKFHKASENIYKIFCKAEENLSFNAPLMQLTVYSCILLISWLGAKMIVGSSLSTGELMSLLTYCMNILMSLMMLSMVFVMITMSLASARRISEVLNEKSDLDNPENPDFSIRMEALPSIMSISTTKEPASRFFRISIFPSNRVRQSVLSVEPEVRKQVLST